MLCVSAMVTNHFVVQCQARRADLPSHPPSGQHSRQTAHTQHMLRPPGWPIQAPAYPCPATNPLALVQQMPHLSPTAAPAASLQRTLRPKSAPRTTLKMLPQWTLRLPGTGKTLPHLQPCSAPATLQCLAPTVAQLALPRRHAVHDLPPQRRCPACSQAVAAHCGPSSVPLPLPPRSPHGHTHHALPHRRAC